jgi:hypothetical protein
MRRLIIEHGPWQNSIPSQTGDGRSDMTNDMARAGIPCEVVLESGDLVDHAAIAAFQRQAFVNVHAPIAPASVQTSAYYAWKYRTPWGPARVATVTYGGDAASMVAAIPTVFLRGIDRWTAWQICDIATAPSLRRRGLLRRGLAALLANLPTGDGVFCLPNRNSHSLMLQMGFQDIGRLSLYVSGAALFTRPRDTTTAIAAESMPVCAEATAFRAPRDSTSVTWRFWQRPGVSYARIKVDGADAIIRPLDVGGTQQLVIMRIYAAKLDAEQRVLRAVMGYAAACRARFVIYLDSAWQGSRAPLFMRVPSYLMRRPMPIVAREFPDYLVRLDAADWDVL